MVSHRRWASQGQRWAAGGRRALRAPLAAGLVAGSGAGGGAAVDGGAHVGEGLQGCGHEKTAGHPLCWGCWCDLPEPLRQAVRSGEIGDAVAWLAAVRAQRVRLGQCVDCGLAVGHLGRCPGKVGA